MSWCPPRLLPGLVVHADWSRHPSKRRAAVATLKGDRYEVEGIFSDWIVSLALTVRQERPVLVGLDFPIGVPGAYAARVAMDAFPRWLMDVSPTRWNRFKTIASRPDEISVDQPFYPATTKGVQQVDQTRGLELSPMQLRRVCENGVPRAESVFWTLGPKQVGRAALNGWELLRPHIGLEIVGIWPFDGELQDIFKRSKVVIAETYPAEYCQQFGLSETAGKKGGKNGKRSGEWRSRNASVLSRRANQLEVDFTPELGATIADGFGESPEKEDDFDALVGLLGMIAVLRSDTPPYAPDGPIRQVEGWILGRPAPPRELL